MEADKLSTVTTMHFGDGAFVELELVLVDSKTVTTKERSDMVLVLIRANVSRIRQPLKATSKMRLLPASFDASSL